MSVDSEFLMDFVELGGIPRSLELGSEQPGAAIVDQPVAATQIQR